MNPQGLLNIENEQIQNIRNNIVKNLSMLDNDAIPDKVRKAVQRIKPSSNDESLWDFFSESKDISHILDFLRLAALQRARSDIAASWFDKLVVRVFPHLFVQRVFPTEMAQQLEYIDKLISSCYQPVANIVGDKLKFQPDEILAIFYQDEYLTRPNGLVPYMLVPNYFEGNNPENWIGVGHETGHHVYRQVQGFREEMEVTVTKAMRSSSVLVGGKSIPVQNSQQRFWFNCLEETFADLYGILMLGAAFVYSELLIIDSSGHQKPEKMLKSDQTHPTPLIRGEMGIYIYEWLLKNSPDPGKNPDNQDDLNNLKSNWEHIIYGLHDKTMRDPHTPKSPSLVDEWNKSGEMDYDETVVVMKLILETMLNSEFRALGCNRLQNLVNFQKDEQERLAAEKSLNNRQPTNFDGFEPRIYVAAARLALH